MAYQEDERRLEEKTPANVQVVKPEPVSSASNVGEQASPGELKSQPRKAEDSIDLVGP